MQSAYKRGYTIKAKTLEKQNGDQDKSTHCDAHCHTLFAYKRQMTLQISYAASNSHHTGLRA